MWYSPTDEKGKKEILFGMTLDAHIKEHQKSP